MSEDTKQTKTVQQKAVENYRRDKTGVQFHFTKEEMELWERMKNYLGLDTHPELMRWLIDRAVRSIRKQHGRNLLKPPKNKSKK